MKSLVEKSAEDCKKSITREDSEMLDRMFAEYRASKRKKLEDAKKSDDNKSEYAKGEAVVRKPYIYTDDAIYLTVRDARNNPLFAYLKDEKIVYTDNILRNNETIYPQNLPFKNNLYYPVVGIPVKEQMEESELLCTEELYISIKTHIKKYVDLEQDDIEMIVYYIMFTWFYKKVNTVSYLRLLGDTGKGKSRIIRVISDLCFYRMNASGASTLSAITRYNELWHGTLSMDESDIPGGAKNPIIKYINLGFEEGQYIIKSNMNDYNDIEIFDPYCPKVFAMREPFLDNATEGRLFSFSPREVINEDIPHNVSSKYNGEVEKLRSALAIFTIHNWQHVDGDNLFEFRDMPIEPRLKQISSPISLIFQLMPSGEDKFKRYILKRQNEVRKIRARSPEGTAFNHLYSMAVGDEKPSDEFDCFYTEDGNLSAITPTMLAQNIGEKAGPLSKRLASIGIDSYTERVDTKNGRKKTRMYLVSDEFRWREMYRRYYYPSSDQEIMDTIPACPEVLKSKNYTEIGNSS